MAWWTGKNTFTYITNLKADLLEPSELGTKGLMVATLTNYLCLRNMHGSLAYLSLQMQALSSASLELRNSACRAPGH